MKTARYAGPHRELRGCFALVRPSEGFGHQWVLVQFDRVKDPECEHLLFDWQLFPRKHFKTRRSLSQSHARKIWRSTP
jgi:hypothetical protein